MALASENGMEREQSSNRRIAKNTLALYVRMFLTMVVGLYTSRVVLATLGVEDYGVYGVVGGITSMLGFLNASMSGATSRFLTFELGRGDKKRLENTFSSAMIVHMGIAAVVLVLAETVGLWFLCHKLVIPPERMTAAHWVYQLSILSSMLAITQVPYNATIIAHENMNVYAYVEILNSVLKLLIVYLLTIGDFDKLILYAVLMLAVSVTVMMTYRIYCVRHYSEAHFHWVWDKTHLKPLLSFSGWDLYGNMSVTVRQQGINFLINMFFGVVFNAASSIATTVNGMVIGFAYNLIQAFRPAIIKEYAAGNIKEMEIMIGNAAKYTVLLFGCMLTPLIFELPFVMELWLGNVPEKAVDFCRLLLIASLFNLINNVIGIGIHATGNIKRISLVTGSLIFACVPFVYLLFEFNFNIDWAYIILINNTIMVLITNTIILKIQISEINISKIYKDVLQSILIVSLATIVVWFINMNLPQSFIRMIIEIIINLVVVATFLWFLLGKKRMLFLKKMIYK
jgi:O-antigen/teichoic acid export membrane protein